MRIQTEEKGNKRMGKCAKRGSKVLEVMTGKDEASWRESRRCDSNKATSKRRICEGSMRRRVTIGREAKSIPVDKKSILGAYSGTK